MRTLDSIEQRASRSDQPWLQRFLRATFVATGTNFIDLYTWLMGAWLGALVVAARWHDGVWPHPHTMPSISDPEPFTSVDPKAFPILYFAVLLGLLALAFVLPLVLGYLVGCIWSPALRPSRRVAGAFAALSSIVAVIWVCDPCGFLLWFAD